ncbi:hypothetical protein [Roseiflexus sp.]
MSAPRIETLLISLVLLVAAGVALAAAYAPSIAPPQHADPGQERVHEALPSPGTNTPERPESAVQEATHVTDDGILPLPDISIDAQRATAGVTIAGGIVTLVLVVAITRQRIGKATPPCQRTTGPGVPIDRLRADMRVFGRTAQQAALSAVGCGSAAFQNAWIAAQHAASAAFARLRRAPGQPDVHGDQHPLVPCEQWTPRVEHGYPDVQTCLPPNDDYAVNPVADTADVPDAAGRIVPDIAPHVQDRIATTTHAPEDYLSDRHLKDAWHATDVRQNPATPLRGIEATIDTGDPDAPLSIDVMTERAAMVIATILDIGERQGMTRSVVTFGEASIDHRRARVHLMIDAHPGETELLAALPEKVQTALPGAQAQWRQTTYAQTVLTCVIPANLPTTQSGRLFLPIGQHGPASRLPTIHRSTPAISFLPLRTWRHIGFYGGKAIDTASSALVGLLYAEAPAALAVTIIDQGQISAYYEGTPHIVPMPGSAAESLIALARAMRHVAESDGAIRPLLIVLVEPDAPTFAAYDDLIARLARYPAAPVYTLLVQRRLPETNRWRSASVITHDGEPQRTTGGRRSSSEMLRIVAPHLRIERRACACDATFLAAMTASLRGSSSTPEMPSVWNLVKVS